MSGHDSAASSAVTELRTWNLALSFQEVFTAALRVRYANQSVPSAAAFRQHLKQALQMADQDARSRGYTPEDVKSAIFAVVAFLDESVLNSNNPVFSDWARMPLQEEITGEHVGGVVFFQRLRGVLDRPDSLALADLLEIYQLCMELGYRGQYGGGGGDVHAIMSRVGDRISRIRGQAGPLSPRWSPPEEMVRSGGDPWLRGLIYSTAGIAVLAVVLFVLYKLLLNSGLSDLSVLAGQPH